MKKYFVFALGLSFAFASYGQEAPANNYREYIQNFYLVKDNRWLLEGGFTNITGEIEYENETEEIEDAFTTVIGQYGFNEQLNVGTELNVFEEKEGRDGLGNWELYARGRLEIYLYEFRYFYAPEDGSQDNAYHDNYYSLKAGIFKNGWGFLANWQSEYSTYAELEAGSETTLEGFYEYLSDEGNIWAASVGTLHMDQGELLDEDLTYYFVRAYAVYSFGGIDILPEIQQTNQFNDSDTIKSASRTNWQIRLRKVF